MYEIFEHRLVTQNGNVPPQAPQKHSARVYGDEGYAELRISPHDPGAVWIKLEGREGDGTMPVYVADLRRAVADLQALAGMDSELASEDTDFAERAAQVVERVCEALTGNEDPYRETLATDLRSTSLALIERASRRA